MSKSQPTTHDYTRLGWGHNITFTSISEDGKKGNVVGHGLGVKQGDYLILANGPTATTRYRITKVKQTRPADCWRAKIEFAPREVRAHHDATADAAGDAA